MHADWNMRQRAGWWAKFAVMVAPTVAILSLFATCGGVRLFGVQMQSDAKAQHAEISAEFNNKLEKSMVRVEAAIDKLNERMYELVKNNKQAKRR